MGWKSIINPWGYNLELERELALVEQQLRQTEGRIRAKNRENNQLASELRVEKAIVQALEGAVERLHKIIDEGHFRNPATGRLGPKGQTYQ